MGLFTIVRHSWEVLNGFRQANFVLGVNKEESRGRHPAGRAKVALEQRTQPRDGLRELQQASSGGDKRV